MPGAKDPDSGPVKPLRLAFGAFSLTVGVLLICLIHILCAVSLIAICSSVESIVLVGVVIPPRTQVMGASYALAGLPIIVLAGVSALYRIKYPLMLYFYYLGGTFILDVSWLLSLLYEADLCSSVVASEFISMGPAFVCGLSDTAMFVSFTVAAVFFLYFMYIVWSAAAQIDSFQPALLQHGQEPPKFEDAEEKAPQRPQVAFSGKPMGGMPMGRPGGMPMQAPFSGYGGMAGAGGIPTHSAAPPSYMGPISMSAAGAGGYGSMAGQRHSLVGDAHPMNPRPSMPVHMPPVT